MLILVWNRSWLSREPRECTNVFSVSIPNKRTIPSAGLQLKWGKCRQLFILKLPLVKRKQVRNTMKMSWTLASKFDFSFCHAHVVFTPSAMNFASMCIKKSSNDNITEILSRFSRSASQLADLIGRSPPDSGVSNALENARSSLNSVWSDTRLANNISRLFCSNPGTSSGSSTSRATLPSVTRQHRSYSSHCFAPYRQSGKKAAGREPERFNMKLLVIDHLPELSEGTRSISNYHGQAILETAFF